MPKELPEDIKLRFDNLKGSLNTYVSQIKTLITQERDIVNSSKLFLFKGLHLDLKPCHNSSCETFNSFKELFSRADLQDQTSTKDGRAL